jgi:uncharacterized protein DUF5752
MSTGTKVAVAPFETYTLAHVSRMGGQTASTLRELAEGLETCSDESIYHHTIVAIRNQLVLTDSVTNDFVQWARTSLKREELASHLAMADMKDCQSIGDLRGALCEIVRAYMEARPETADEAAENPFYFCEGMDLAVPLRSTARTLEEFRQCVLEMSGESFYLHFVASRTRREIQSNDFSVWLKKSLGLGELAAKINEIDVMDSTLDGAKEKILDLLDAERDARLKVTSAKS